MARYHDDDDEDHIDMRPLLRLTVWGCGAIIAVGATVLAGRTDVGTARARVALATFRTAPVDLLKHPNDMLASRPVGPDETEKRLAEEVRALTADRDRLAERVASLEHNLSDLTGSIARASAPAANGAPTTVTLNAPPNVAPAAPRDDRTDAAPPAATAEPQVPPINFTGSNDDQARVAAAAPPPSQPQPGVGHPVDVPLPRPGPLATIQSYVYSASPPATQPTRLASTNADTPPPPPGDKAYALDLGTATNVNSLRAHWGSVRAAHGALLEGLQPLVSVRQSSRPGFTEFHLVAGPVSDPDAAARLCSALASVRVACRPTVYNGQRLELR
jgi:hypothetical protein